MPHVAGILVGQRNVACLEHVCSPDTQHDMSVIGQSQFDACT